MFAIVSRARGCCRGSRPSALSLAGLTAAALLLGACTTMQQIPAGTPLSEVQARYGAPTHSCTLPDGQRRLIWSMQPLGQYAWATTVGPDERVGAVEQILSNAAFAEVKQGEWDHERLACMFGPPAEVSQVGLPSVRQEVWSYRYKQAGAWNSLMHIYFSEDGRVTRLHPGPDPFYEPIEIISR